MRTVMLKIFVLALFVAALVGAPALSDADDSMPTTSPSTRPDASGPTKFFGSVTAVDVNAKTFSIGDQAYTITGESQVTKDGKTIDLTEDLVGQPARGSYTQSSDGKLNVTKVRFGKKTGGKGGSKSGKKKKSASTEPDAAQ